MRIRLMQPGFETYNGQMGVHFFENGLSVSEVSSSDAVRLGAVMLCQWEDESSPNVAQSLLDNAHTPAPVYNSDGQGGDNDAEAARNRGGAPAVEQVTPSSPRNHELSEVQLGEVADREGIKGLRAIADPLGIKGNSIKDLIAALTKAG